MGRKRRVFALGPGGQIQKSLDLNVPLALLTRADEVIE
jgi:hypothetical protein